MNQSQVFDRFGGHWVGTIDFGLWYKAPGQKEYVNFKPGIQDGSHISASDVYALVAKENGVWIGTHGGGVNFYDFNTGRISFYHPDMGSIADAKTLYIRTLFVDSHSNLWLGTVDGLYQLNLIDGSAKKHISSPSSKLVLGYVYAINELSDGSLMRIFSCRILICVLQPLPVHLRWQCG